MSETGEVSKPHSEPMVLDAAARVEIVRLALRQAAGLDIHALLRQEIWDAEKQLDSLLEQLEALRSAAEEGLRTGYWGSLKAALSNPASEPEAS